MFEKGLKVGLRVKEDLIGGQGCCNIGETELKILAFSRCQRIGELIFMKIDQCRRAVWAAKSLKVCQAHQIGNDQTVIIFKRGNFFDKV